jgi:hypothetical protein
MNKLSAPASMALLIGFVMTWHEASADAQTICGTGSPGPVVYIAGSSASKPFLAALARVLYPATNAMPLTIVYKSIGSCSGVSAIVNGDTMISGTASYWDPMSTNTGNEVMCTIGTGTIAAALLPDVAVSDVFAESCLSLANGLPSDIKDFFGPVQTMTFVVPKASNEKAISATAAYFVFGFGADSGVAPWNNNALIFRRNATSGTQAMIGTAIGVSSAKFKGVDANGSSGVITKVSSSPSQSTIGILADTDVSDTVSLSLNVLAYKHYGQSCAYYPDSAPGSKDKANVRDGHYAIWGPLHFLAHVDANGFVANVNSRRVINFITGTLAAPQGVDLIQVFAVSNLVPACAMRVKRTIEMGPVSTFQPDSGCGCHYDFVATGRNSCSACTKDADCPSASPKCNYGYCELQ